MTTASQPLPATDDRPVLVLAASGKTGRRVTGRLRERGVAVRPVSRRSSPAFDWDDASTWPAVLAGARSAYVVFTPDLVVPGAVETVTAFAAAARTAGLERLVLLSGRGEDEAETAEAAVREVGPPLVVVRAAWFTQNVTEGDFADAVSAGVLALPVGDVPEPFVDVEDVADVVVAALLEDRHLGAVYAVTGPRSLTWADLAAELTDHGRPVEFVRRTAEEAESDWRAAGLPDDAVWLLTTLFGTVFDGRNARPDDGVRRALGREARDVREVLGAPVVPS